MKKLFGIGIFLIGLTFYTSNVNTIESDKSKVTIVKNKRDPLPESYQKVLSELAEFKGFSPSAKDLMQKNIGLQKTYNIIKNYSELGLAEKEASSFYRNLLLLDFAKFNALIDFIDEIQRLLNYESFPIPDELAKKYSDTALGAMDRWTRNRIKETMIQQDIIEIRKLLLKEVILATVFRYGINKEAFKRTLAYIYQKISDLDRQKFETLEINKKLDSLIQEVLKYSLSDKKYQEISE